MLLLEKLGRSIVKDNAEFFEEVVGADSKHYVEADEFMKMLSAFISNAP